MTSTASTPAIDLLKLPFDQYGRYKIIAEVADALRADLAVPRLRILDIGGYQIDERFGERLPLTLFLPHDDIGALDTVASDLPNYYQGDGTALQFDDDAFDLIVSADTFEHIPPDRRQQFVRELARVAKYGVALVAPFFSPETELAEIVFDRYLVAELRYKHPFLQEHREYGLPHVDQTERWFAELGCTTATFPSGYIHSWLEMMVLRSLLWRLTGDDGLVGALEEYYNRVLAPLERREPAYRHLIVAAPADQPKLVAIAQHAIDPTLREAASPPSSHDQFLQQFLLQLMPMGLLDRMRHEDEATVTHWQSENARERETKMYWEREANRVELERRALEQERETMRQEHRQELTRLTAERDQWRQLAQRPLLSQLIARLKDLRS